MSLSAWPRRLLALQPTIRFRLTAMYVGLFFFFGAALIALNYALVVQTAFSPLSSPAISRAVAKLPLTASDSSARRPVFVVGVGQTARLEEQLRQEQHDQAVNRMLTQSLLALGVAGLLSIVLGSLAARRALDPIQAIVRASRQASERNLRSRVNLKGPQDELKELADTLDRMLDRLQAAFEGQQRFVANASHELRTPLAIARTAIDVTLADPDCDREALLDMASEVRCATERAERLMDSLLVLARSDERVDARDAADLAEAARQALDDIDPERRSLGLRVETVLATAPVADDRPLLERMVANLIENGVRHNLPGGWLRVCVGPERTEAFVHVANSGREIPEEQVPSLFERFRRLGAARTRSERGAGLGLSIVRAVVVNHGGTVVAHALPGGGLEVRVTLPACG